LATKSGSGYVPAAGDFIRIDLEPTKGHEQRGRRPAMVISPLAYNQRVELCLACPLTNQAKGYPFEVAIPGGLSVTGVVLADQVRCLSWSERHADLIAHAPDDLLEDVREKLAALMEL
jgi:mRNA interferase MazF